MTKLCHTIVVCATTALIALTVAGPTFAQGPNDATNEWVHRIYFSAHQVTVGNPRGNVTVVEFFDYNCPHCKGALNDILALMNADANLRIVLKELPVLGPPSVEAAQVAVAVRMQDKSGRKYLEFHKKLLGGHGPVNMARALAVAEEVGLDIARIKQDAASAEMRATLKETLELAEKLGLDGTPTYVINSDRQLVALSDYDYVYRGDIIRGAVGIKALKEKIDKLRAIPPTTPTVIPLCVFC